MAQAKYKSLTQKLLAQNGRPWREPAKVFPSARNDGAPQVPIVPIRKRRHAAVRRMQRSCRFADMLLPGLEGAPALAAVRIFPHLRRRLRCSECAVRCLGVG